MSAPTLKPDAYLDQPVTRANCLVVFLLWLCMGLAPCFLFALAARGELNWERDAYTSDRVWLIREAEASGVAYASQRAVTPAAAPAGAVCVHYQAYFWLWRGQRADENADYCECVLPDGQTSDCP